MSKNASIPFPKQIGGTNIVESFNKILLSNELKEFLSSLDAELSVTFRPGSTQPELRVLARNGTNVCSIDEFVKLGSFRRWVTDELKAIEKEEASSKKVELIAYFLREAKTENKNPGERIGEANESKFRQLYNDVKNVHHNLDLIENTIDNPYRKYLNRKGKSLVTVCYKLMLRCVLPDKVEKESYDEALFEAGIPKWLSNKLVDKSFTSNVGRTADILLFPTGNYLKSIALTTRELQSEEFIDCNKVIMKKSGVIVALARNDWTKLTGPIPENMKEDFLKFYTNFPWTLNSPYSVEDVLDVRVAGKTPPSFKPRQRPTPKPGAKARPETETQRFCRDVHNKLGTLVSSFLHVQNLIIPLARPKEEFWHKLISDVVDWEITPTKGLYEQIKESKKDLSCIKDLTNVALLKLTGEIMCQTIQTSVSSDVGVQILKLMNGCKGLCKPPSSKGTIGTISDPIDLETMRKSTLGKVDFEEAKNFLGVVSKKQKETKQTTRRAVRMNTEALKELSVLKDHNPQIYIRAREWISTTFKTGKTELTHQLAARSILGEVLKYQDELLADDFDEFAALEQIEDYYEED